MKAKTTKLCKDCNFCKRAYKRIWCEYYTKKRYLCTLGDRLTLRENSCDNWQKKELDYDLSQKKIRRYRKGYPPSFGSAF